MKSFISRLVVCSLFLAFAGGCAENTSGDGDADVNRPKPGSPKDKYDSRGKAHGRPGSPGTKGGPTD